MFRTSVSRGIISRIFLAFMLCSFLGLALTFVGTPSAHAAPAHATAQGICLSNYLATSPVYDSYNHLEGWINLLQDSCTHGVAAAFFGNNNTWKSVTVYVEYSYVYGYLKGGPSGWGPNKGVWSPSYYSSSCYYAEVDLLDNRGIHKWVGTSNACV